MLTCVLVTTGGCGGWKSDLFFLHHLSLFCFIFLQGWGWRPGEVRSGLDIARIREATTTWLMVCKAGIYALGCSRCPDAAGGTV